MCVVQNPKFRILYGILQRWPNSLLPQQLSVLSKNVPAYPAQAVPVSFPTLHPADVPGRASGHPGSKYTEKGINYDYVLK